MSTVRFDSIITRTNNSVILTTPKSAQKVLPAETTVEGVVNHFPFRAALGPTGIDISNAIRTAARAAINDTVAVELTRIGDEPETRVPADLQQALAGNPKATAAWAKITPMARRDWILSILVVRQLETRKGRITKTVDMLTHGKGRVCCFPGLNWLTKDYVSPADTWQRLPRTSGY